LPKVSKVTKLIATVVIVVVILGSVLLYPGLITFPQIKPGEPSEPTGPLATCVTLTITPSTIVEGKTTTFVGTLEEEEAAWRRLADRTINFYVGETEETLENIGDTTTDSDGHYTYVWSDAASLPVGEYIVKASWVGGDGYLAAFKTATLSVISAVGGLTVDSSSYCRFNDPTGKNVSIDFKPKTSTTWYTGKILKDWYVLLLHEFSDSYGFEPECCCPPPVAPNYGCCCVEPYWLVEETVPGTLAEEPPGISDKPIWLHNVLDFPPDLPDYVLEPGPKELYAEWAGGKIPPPPDFLLEGKTKLHAKPTYAHSGDGRGGEPPYSMRLYLKYGSGNDVDEWWHYRVAYPMWWKSLGMYGVATYTKEVDKITDLGGGKVVFDWWAYREKENEKLINEDHVKAYAMEVVIGITDNATGRVYRLHYMQDIINQLDKEPESTPTDVYIRDKNIMPGGSWQHYLRDISYDFGKSFDIVPDAQYKITGIRIGTLWNGVSSGVEAGIDFDDLKFTKLGATDLSIHFTYTLPGCEEVEAISVNLSAEMEISGNIIASKVENRTSSAPKSDLWSDTWDLTLSIPPDSELGYGKSYNSTTTVVANVKATYIDGKTVPFTGKMTISVSNIEWFNCIVPTEDTTVTVTTS
jgi:hypothetical protein